ncbi:uncharacterized protein LOC125669640 isoform X2 [Ostrea edulis]|uniref:uncharacterized protein LOC125669640 isoform X2 n=1 Tax=Ostrea edulis TaxID=37623 RepID=UPI0024AEF06C|nr:uncharacterized protein LOC125669640 isoform X2 [Ostrea edulis]
MMSDNCIKCQWVVQPRQEAIQYERWQHRTCNSVHNLSRVRSISKLLNATIPGVVPSCSLNKGSKGKARVKTYKEQDGKKIWTRKMKKTIFEEKKEDSEFTMRVPDDSIYFMEFFPETEFSVEDAIKLQQDYADPMILNNAKGVVYLDILCNMKTKKQTRFISEFSERLFFPHTFEVECPRRCFVICKTDEESLTAQRLGAVYAGDEKLLQRLDRKKGDLTRNDFDIILCTPEMQEALLPWRNALRDVYPSTETFTLDADIEKMMLKQKDSVLYNCKKEGSLGKIQVPIAQLSMGIDKIIENFDFFFLTLLNNPKAAQVKPGEDFVTSARLLVPPCPEQLKLQDAELRRFVKTVKQTPQKDTETKKKLEASQ